MEIVMKNQLLRGTLILTVAGFVTRLIGFGYRIFLADELGEVNLGIYQLIFPVYSICFTIYAAGIQTAVSQMISHNSPQKQGSILKTSLILSLICSLSLSCAVHLFRVPIANKFLGTRQAGELLGIMAYIFPFCGITSVINGYFYGINRAKIPAVTQIIEQLVRVIFVFAVCFSFDTNEKSVYIAVLGLVIGELCSNIYNIYHVKKHISMRILLQSKLCIGKILRLSLPLSGTKLVIALLGSIESILIPVIMQRYGYSVEVSIGLYGILTGVVLPFILFPGTITNSLSVLLLPAIAKASGTNNRRQIRSTSSLTVRYSLLLGVLTSSLFLNFGVEIGQFIFHSENAGKLLTVMAFLCPFLYVTTTLGSIINGLGKTGITFLFTVIGLLVRILFLLFIAPHFGIYGYIMGMLISQILICLLHGGYLLKTNQVPCNLSKYFVWPMIFSCSVMYFSKIAGMQIIAKTGNNIVVLASMIPAVLLILLYFFMFHLVSRQDFKVKKY